MFQQGLSGLNAASKSLDVIGNNIANASTVGFKSSQAQFADLYANSLNGVSGNNAGIGVSVSKLAQQFTQGNIESSSNPLDVAINGGGFFRLVVNGAVEYSRNGQFHEDANHTLVNAQGAVLTGYLSNKAGVIQMGAPVPLTLDKSDLKPVETTTASFAMNLSSAEKVPATVPFDANDPTSYNTRSDTNVYDSLGTSHIMTTYYVKTDANTWDVYSSADGKEVVSAGVVASIAIDQTVTDARTAYNDAVRTTPPVASDIAAAAYNYASAAYNSMLTAASVPPANASQDQLDALTAAFGALDPTGSQAITGMTPDDINAKLASALNVPAVKSGTLLFTKSGALDPEAMAQLPVPQTLPFQISLPIFPDTGAQQPMTIATSFDNITQYGSVTNPQPATQNGYSAGSWQRYSIDENGVILGQYSNGKSRPMGQIAMANFASVDGLTPLGNNAWAESSSSGPPVVGVPNAGSMGQLRSSAVETSNTDLTAELVNMITAQRVYQANSQTIKTEDSILQTLVNLR
ncbi:flagellar hook-basal body complex protein [Pseudoduganella sp. FT25W]|jgi:flagellar hook protein FlgE|uniref:Flagellar hook protein FlgE n=1 Tax=Duganella alba TaxID=2666081 RepID=A0A6L5QBA6_9BURK|nr:flagellar hook protein FlgE [Duganella alba]MRX07054.1 flagellar hook-basal body complex protein [Duganella alba]MRX15251.1 flagellar hook-basal body complex protein [Duganella alba]